MARKVTKTKKTSEQISFAEFMAWLSGVEDMQGDNWSPSLEQWNRIRSKLSTVVRTSEIVDNIPTLMEPVEPMRSVPVAPTYTQAPRPPILSSELSSNPIVVTDDTAYVSSFS